MVTGLDADLKDLGGLVIQPSFALKPLAQRRWPIEILGNAGTTLICIGGLAVLAFDQPGIGGPAFIIGIAWIVAAAVLNEVFGGAT